MSTSASLALDARAQPGFRGLLPGFMLCGVIALAASFVSDHYGGPKFLYALLLGIAFNFMVDNPKTLPGIEMSAKNLVRIGVGLLGARIAFSDVAALGAAGIVALAGTVVLTIGFGVLLARLLRLPPTLGLLSGGGTGICGISATLAISSTLPQTRDTERYTLLTAIGVASLSTAAMVLYPLAVPNLGLSATEAGLFLGGSIHDVAQVVGAGFMISPQVGDAATLSKMFRVALLVPVVIACALVFRKRRGSAHRGAVPGRDGHDRRQPLLPAFLVAFAALVAVNSLGWIPQSVQAAASGISGWCLVIAIAALGVKTSPEKLVELGWRPVVLMAGEAIFVLLYMLSIVFLLRLLAT